MGKKVKFKVKKGKAKIKLKSGDDALPLGEKDIRDMLVLAMASAVGSGANLDTRLLPKAETIASPSLLPSGEATGIEANDE